MLCDICEERSFQSYVCLYFCCRMQLRQTVRKFCEEKLAPYADEIDKNNEFPRMRVS